MRRLYQDVAEYQKSKLFSGAMDLDWVLDNPEKAESAAKSYLFHGRKYHAGNVEDIASSGQHVLTDSVSFVSDIIDALANDGEQMILGIAGYGAGKSHLAIVLSELLSVRKEVSESILTEISKVDDKVGSVVAQIIHADSRPFLVIPINGMRNAGLKDLFFGTIVRILERDCVSKECLNQFDERFAYLRDTVLYHNDDVLITKILHSAEIDSRNEFVNLMNSFNEEAYLRVSKAFSDHSIKLYPPASSGELKNMITAVAESLCGDGKPYRAMLILFDEFGKYMSFAAANEPVAGAGIMQLLYEGIHGGADAQIVLLGLSQLDLKEYQRGIGNANASNNMSRYVSRFDSARKYYLSVCFESLVANLIDVKDKSLLPSLSDTYTINTIRQIHKSFLGYFKAAVGFPVWDDIDNFIKIICRGCWPLSPFALWTLSYVVSKNSILQQRSGFNIIANIFDSASGKECPDSMFLFSAVDLFDCGLGSEFYEFESNSRTADQTALEYGFLCEKYNQQLSEKHHKVLKAIVLSHKLGAYSTTEFSTNELLAYLADLSRNDVETVIKDLSDTFNAVAFNNASKLYDIQSNSMSIFEFKRKIQSFSDNFRYGKTDDELFVSVGRILQSEEAEEIRASKFRNIECDFAINHFISSIEWYYESCIVASYDFIDQVKNILKDKYSAMPVRFSESKGLVIYIILPEKISVHDAKNSLEKLFGTIDYGYALPVMLLLISDGDSKIQDICLELMMLNNLDNTIVTQFGSLVQKYRIDLLKNLDSLLDDGIKERNYFYPAESISGTLKQAGNQLFDFVFPKAISFHIDGFSSENSNGGKSITEFIEKLSKSGVSVSSFSNLRTKEKNRCHTLLEEGWKIFDSNGSIRKYPLDARLDELFRIEDAMFKENGRLNLYEMYNRLTLPPYGANSSQATLLVFVYLAGRQVELEFRKDESLVDIAALIEDKNAFASKTSAFVKKVWENVEAYPAVHEDARWGQLIARWKNENDIKQLLNLRNDAENMLGNNITVPAYLIAEYNECLNKSNDALRKYNSWQTKSKQIEKDMYAQVANSSIRRVVNRLGEYVQLYDSTMKDGTFIVPDDISDAYETVCDAMMSYLNDNIEKWYDEHPLPLLTKTNDEYRSLKKSYDSLASALKSVGLSDLADDVRSHIDALDQRIKVYLEYKKVYDSVIGTINQLDELINSGIYASKQADIYKEQLETLQKNIKGFPAQKLKLITGYNFDGCTSRIEQLLNRVNQYSSEVRNRFSSLLDADIKTYDDIKKIEKDVAPILAYFGGIDKASEDYKDAELLSKEIALLEIAYDDIYSCEGNESEIDAKVESWLDRIDKELNGDFIYDDSFILGNVASSRKEENQAKGHAWISQMENKVKENPSPNEAYTLLETLKSVPAYLAEIDKKRCSELRETIEMRISENRVKYLIDLFNGLSEREKDSFLRYIGRQ